MKVVFPSQKDKALALETARRVSLEACGQMYLHMLEEGVIDESFVEPKVAEESLVDKDVDQIKL